MTLTELKTFLAIIDTGSLVRASEQLHVTQSTVTARLKSLEAELGQALLHRNKSGATLTAAGVRLRTYARTISDLWQQAQQEVALPDGLSTLCNLACVPDLWASLGAPFFNTLRLHHPHVAISVWLGSETEVADWLASGKSDIAFSRAPTTNPHQTQIAMPAEQLVLVTTDPDALVKDDSSYVYVEMGDAIGRDHAIAYADSGAPRLSFNSAALGLRHLLEIGGSAYLPKQVIAPYIASHQLHILPETARFERPCFLLLNTKARETWGWFEACFQRFNDIHLSGDAQKVRSMPMY